MNRTYYRRGVVLCAQMVFALYWSTGLLACGPVAGANTHGANVVFLEQVRCNGILFGTGQRRYII